MIQSFRLVSVDKSQGTAGALWSGKPDDGNGCSWFQVLSWMVAEKINQS
jgi:hypothetical protein